MSKKGKPNSRWNRGNKRFTDKEDTEIQKKYREPAGWSKGARVSRLSK
jgi:hypothetical protein